jgi:hypothetical protein
VLNQLYCDVGHPMVNAFNSHAFYLGYLAHHFPKLIIVNMRREPVSNAVSLLRGRRTYRSDITEWWSIRPSHCIEAKHPDPYSQIVCQITETYRAVKAQRHLVGRSRIIDVRYEEFCEHPNAILADIASACSVAGILVSKRENAPPLPDFTARSPRASEEADASHFRSLFDQVDWNDVWS